MSQRYRRHPFRFAGRVGYLYLFGGNRTGELVERSYDGISGGYDQSWTEHMRDLTEELISQLGLNVSDKALDLTCGTGYATKLIVEKTHEKVVGVDTSAGMLSQAKKTCGSACEFVHADILGYLKSVPAESFDVVTCCWGLGYSRPLRVLRQIKRVLKPGGKVGIIDNSVFSLKEVMKCSVQTFMERPEALENLMRFRFLMGSKQLGYWFRLAGLKPQALWNGSKSYSVGSGAEAIERLQATGAAAGFEFAGRQEDSDEIYKRFAEIIEQKYLKDYRVMITHRYLAGIGVKWFGLYSD